MPLVPAYPYQIPIIEVLQLAQGCFLKELAGGWSLAGTEWWPVAHEGHIVVDKKLTRAVER